MALSPTFWRRFSYILVLLLLVVLVHLHLRTGYPSEWNKVQIGMAASQVRVICGRPTYSSGMKPDMWEAPFLWGKWVFQVSCGDYAEGRPDVVYSMVLYFDHDVASWHTILRSDYPPIQDYAAFMRAFGLTPDPNRQYRVVNPSSENR